MITESSSSSRGKRARREVDELDYAYDAGHTREIQHKRDRGEISCAECRRLKIRCNKKVPCSSCVRRGCERICPNGSLSTGQGTRFVLEATEHLHRRVAKMQTRIRQLEDALAASHAEKHPTEPHPLLTVESPSEPETTEQKSIGTVPDASSSISEILGFFGTLSVSDDGAVQFFGPTGESESLLAEDTTEHRPSSSSSHLSAGTDVSENSPSPIQPIPIEGFPFTTSPVSVTQTELESRLPRYSRALNLAEIYMEKAGWVFICVSKEQLFEDLLPAFYPDGYSGEAPTPFERTESSGHGPHDLGLLFVILAIGTLLDFVDEPQETFPPPNPVCLEEGEVYRQASRSALSLAPVFTKPTLATIQALHLISVQNAMSGGDMGTGMPESWALFNVSAHLGQTIGLHRNSSRWGLSPKMVSRRRRLFEDLFMADAWHSLSTGRPPSFSLSFVDTSKRPDASPPSDHVAGMPFSDWAFRFVVDCVSQVALRLLATEAPTYATITELDKLIKDYPTPSGVLPDGTALEPTKKFMQQHTLDYMKEVVVLYVHRHFFAQAVADFPENPLKSVYAASVLASYRAAITVLHAVVGQFATKPALCARFWTRMTFAFSAANVFATIVTQAPSCALANGSAVELDSACLLFTRAAPHSRRAAKALSILAKLNAEGKRARELLKSRNKGKGRGRGKFRSPTDEVVMDSPPPPSSSSLEAYDMRRGTDDILPTTSDESQSRSQLPYPSYHHDVAGSWDGKQDSETDRQSLSQRQFEHYNRLQPQADYSALGHYPPYAPTARVSDDLEWAHSAASVGGMTQWQGSYASTPTASTVSEPFYPPWQPEGSQDLYQHQPADQTSSNMAFISPDTGQYSQPISPYPEYNPIQLEPLPLSQDGGQYSVLDGRPREYAEQRLSHRRSTTTFYQQLGL